MGYLTDRIAEVEAELVQVNAMITSAAAANGVEEVSIGASRTRRVSVDKLFQERARLQRELSTLRAKSTGPVFVRR